jgi:hypothetical protein
MDECIDWRRVMSVAIDDHDPRRVTADEPAPDWMRGFFIGAL